MGTINSAFFLMANALEADQAALNVVANNVANASTTGYTREVANVDENDPIEIGGVEYGSGVTMTSTESIRDSVLEERLAQTQSESAEATSRLSALTDIEDLFTPASSSDTTTDSGDIGTDLSTFFSSYSSLESDPTSVSDREAVISAATTLASDISSAASSLQEQRASLDQDASTVADQVNSLTKSIALLNKQIEGTSPDGDAGTLEDQRTEDLSQLSQLIGINEITTNNNVIDVTTSSGTLLVNGTESTDMTTGTVDGVTHFFVGTTDITSGLASGSGELGGMLTARDTDIPSALSALDELAYGISKNVNALNNSGTDLDGDTSNSGDIFSDPGQVDGSAESMSVVITDPDKIAAAVSASELTITGTNFSVSSSLVEDADTVTPSFSFSGDTTTQSYDLDSAATINSATDLTITGTTATGDTATITAPTITTGESQEDYATALTSALSNAGITGVSVNLSSGTLTISGNNFSTTGSLVQDGATVADDSSTSDGTETDTFTLGSAATINTSTTLTITGETSSGTSVTITAPTITAGETQADYVTALNNALTDAGITGVTVSAAVVGTGDNSIATSVADLANQSIIDGQTPTNYFSSFVSTLGATVSSVTTQSTALSASVTQLQTQRDSLSGVSLNDEAASMESLEKTYEAAAQAFSIVSTLFSSAINLGIETAVS